MSFQALLLAAKYARFELALEACREAVTRIEHKIALGGQRSLPVPCLVSDIFVDATKGRIEDGTPSSRRRQASAHLASPSKPSSSTESLSTRSHPPTINMSEFSGLVIKIPKTKKKDRGTEYIIREDERKEMFRADPRAGALMPHRVWCKECESWIALDKRRNYYLGMWKRHVKQYHLPVSSLS